MFIYIYIQKIHSSWGLFHESNEGFPRLWNSTFFSPQKKKRLWNWTVRSDEVNRKPFTKTVLLTSKTSIYEKFNEPCKPRFNLTDLKTVDGYGSPKFSWLRVFFFFWVLTDSTIDEASTSDIKIATLFVLIPLFSLAHILFFRFLPIVISAFSLSLRFFHLLFLQFSASLCFSFEV